MFSGIFKNQSKTCINSNVSISVNNERKLTSNISKSKLAFPLFNESYSSLIAPLALKLLRINPEYFFWDTRYNYNIINIKIEITIYMKTHIYALYKNYIIQSKLWLFAKRSVLIALTNVE